MFVSIDSADRAEAFALRRAESTGGEFEKDLLPEDIVQFHAVAFVEPQVDVTGVEFQFLAGNGFRERFVDEFEVGIDGDINGGQTAVALEMERDSKVAREPDFLGHLVEAGFAFGDQGADLRGVGGPINDAGGNGLAEFDGSEVELADGDKHLLLPSG